MLRSPGLFKDGLDDAQVVGRHVVFLILSRGGSTEDRNGGYESEDEC
ncbi:hypothetical protein [Streptomyces sp. NPDC058629]